MKRFAKKINGFLNLPSLVLRLYWQNAKRSKMLIFDVWQGPENLSDVLAVPELILQVASDLNKRKSTIYQNYDFPFLKKSPQK